MRKFIIIAILIAGAVWFLCSRSRSARTATASAGLSVPGGMAPPPIAGSQANTPNTPGFLSLQQRRAMSEEDRLAYLERFGEVPKDGDGVDWRLAGQTSWWGKPLDPKVFWKGRVLWLDNSAAMAARRHGRQYPPIPYEDPRFSGRGTADIVGGLAADGDNLPFHVTDQEHAFWGSFEMSHPIPPEDILREQVAIEERMMGTSHWHGDEKDNLQARESIRTQPFRILKYPEEAFSEDALYWSYVDAERTKYQDLTDQGNPAANTLRAQDIANHFGRFGVPTNYLVDPLPDQAQAANAWKIAYLQRLQTQNTDPSYINAYLQAWNLPASALSAGGK